MSTSGKRPPLAPLTIASEKESATDRFLDAASEWFSSILVKEARQALKSRQFLWTFFALLLVVMVWSIGAMSYLQTDDGRNSSPGPFLLFGFWLILGFPLSIVIPFASFRSLAHEFEDGTLQLVSITTMRPHQIIAGKLGVAVLQILVFVSVLAPCVAFTYLLRGTDIRQIWWSLVIAVSGSTMLCLAGLFLASLIQTRTMGVLLSVLFLFVLAFVYWIWGISSYGLTYAFSGVYAANDGGQVALMLAMYLAFVATTSFVLFAAASGQISFAADNRSSLVRVAMMVQQVVLFGLVVALATYQFDEDMASVMSLLQCHYWLAMGAMMCSVPATMSRRVRRALPTTIVGRSFKSLFIPGPGRGFLLAVSNVWGWSLLTVIVFLLARWILPGVEDSWGRGGTPHRALSGSEISEMAASVFGNCVYATSFLSLLYLVLTARFRRNVDSGPFLGFLVGLLMVLLFTFAPMIVQMRMKPSWWDDYSILQCTNWYWTTSELNSDGLAAGPALNSLIIATTAMLFLGYFAFRTAGQELHYLPETVPNRVMEEAIRRKGHPQIAIAHPLD